MLKHSALWLGLSLSSFGVTIPLLTTLAVQTTVAPSLAITQTTRVRNVGGPLAKQLQGKPVVVDIYASWCPACQNVAPTLTQLKQDYAGKANFVVLDVSDQSKAKQSENRAKQLGLSQFFQENKSQTGLIAIIDPATGNILTQYRNNPSKSDYTSVLNKAIVRK